MALLTSCWAFDLLAILVSIPILFYINFKLRSRYFWTRRGYPYKNPTFIFGNFDGMLKKRGLSDTMDELYARFKDEPLFGAFLFSKPVVVLRDLELVKHILVKDFQYFHDRGIKFDKEHEPFSGNLVNMNGQQWRNLRVKLTPTFTSGKMKMMFPTMMKCGEILEEYLLPLAKNGETIEMKDLFARLNTDIIASCAFGIEVNSINNPDAEFRKYGRKTFKMTPWLFVSGVLMNTIPEVNKIVTFPTDVTRFFMKVVLDTVKYREENNVKRKDFMDLLIQLKNKGTIEDVDSKFEEGGDAKGDPFTMQCLAAQAFVFLAAGFESSSNVVMFLLYELALNPDLQRKVHAEIDSVMAKHNGHRTYEALLEMDLLERCLFEALRKYPVTPFMIRECTKQYQVPNSDKVINKGEVVIIPTCSIHKDPEHFPDPERFDPDRHLPEEKEKRDHYAFLPFGEGPRTCIGNRFGILQSKVGITSLLYKYEIHIASTTDVPIQLDTTNFFPSPLHGMPLKVTLRGST